MNPTGEKGWFGRNWKWFLPVGCLSIVLIAVAFVGGAVYFVFGSIKSSFVYQQAIERARSNAEVVQALGEPIEPGWLISGNINIDGSSGHADLSIPVSGPKKSGKVYASAEKKLGKWDFSALEVEIEGDPKRINLLPPRSE